MKKLTITALSLIILTTLRCYSGEKVIHQSFNFTENSLQEIIADLQPEIRERINENPYRFLQLADSLLNQPEELFYLADKKHALSRDQAPAEVVSPFDYGISVTREERTVSSLIIDHLKDLCDSAKKSGLNIVFASGYRSYDYQEGLYNRYVEYEGQEEADRFSAKPGTSQHQLGTAVDFGSISDEYALTPEGKWLTENAGNFGFSLSYPEDYEHITGYMWECWHYRYITVDGIHMQREFFSDIQQYMMEFWFDHKEELKKARR